MISMQGASVLTLYAILIVAVVQDITSMRISNRLIIMGLFLSMAFGIVLGGMPRIIQVLLNISIPVIMLYLFYLIGVLGAGDIKLFRYRWIYKFKNIDRLCAGSICGRSSNSRAQDVVYAQS